MANLFFRTSVSAWRHPAWTQTPRNLKKSREEKEHIIIKRSSATRNIICFPSDRRTNDRGTPVHRVKANTKQQPTIHFRLSRGPKKPLHRTEQPHVGGTALPWISPLENRKGVGGTRHFFSFFSSSSSNHEEPLYHPLVVKSVWKKLKIRWEIPPPH